MQTIQGVIDYLQQFDKNMEVAFFNPESEDFAGLAIIPVDYGNGVMIFTEKAIKRERES